MADPHPINMALLPILSATTYHAVDFHPDAPVFPSKPLGVIQSASHRDDERLQDFKLKPRPRVASHRVGG